MGLIVALAATVIGLLWALALLGRDEFQSGGDDEELATPPAKVSGGRVVVAPVAQAAAGIVVEQPPAAEYLASQRFFGVVVDPRPLVEAQQKHLALASQVAASEALIAQRRSDLARVQGLFDEGRNATRRELEAARAALAVEEQRAASLAAERRAVDDGLRVALGEALATGIGDRGSLLGRAIARQVDLVQFTVPVGTDPRGQNWHVASAAGSAAGAAATLVGRSPQSVPGLQGETWLLSLPASGLPAGARVRVLADSARPVSGVRVPAPAIVRFGGKSWVYVRVAPDQFERHALPADRPLGDGLFTDTLTPQAQLVVSGAQLLLSEEFKFQIKNENTD